MQHPLFVGTEWREKLLLDALRDYTQLSERISSSRRQADEMSAAVVGIAPSLEVALRLELVEETDEMAPVVAQSVRDRRLRLARSFLQEREHGVMLRIQLARPERLVVSAP